MFNSTEYVSLSKPQNALQKLAGPEFSATCTNFLKLYWGQLYP